RPGAGRAHGGRNAAVGVRRAGHHRCRLRRLDAPGVDDFTGSGIYYGAAATEGQACKDEDVYIVGGANSAGQAAVYFARTARSVTIVVRGDSLERSMSHYLIQQIAELPNVSVRTGSEVVGAGGSDHLERLR